MRSKLKTKMFSISSTLKMYEIELPWSSVLDRITIKVNFPWIERRWFRHTRKGPLPSTTKIGPCNNLPIFSLWTIIDFWSAIHSAIHKATGGGRNDLQRLFPYSRLQGFSGIVPGKGRNGSAGGFVNSTVTKPLAELFRALPGTIPVEWKNPLSHEWENSP